MTTKRDVLDAAIAATADRGLNYGSPEDNFTRIARRWQVHFQNRYGRDVAIDAHDVAMMMADLKLARLENKPDHPDSWIDLAGYAACGGAMHLPADPSADHGSVKGPDPSPCHPGESRDPIPPAAGTGPARREGAYLGLGREDTKAGSPPQPARGNDPRIDEFLRVMHREADRLNRQTLIARHATTVARGE